MKWTRRHFDEIVMTTYTRCRVVNARFIQCRTSRHFHSIEWQVQASIVRTVSRFFFHLGKYKLKSYFSFHVNVENFVDMISGCRHPLQWRHNERDSVPNHQPHDCLLNRLFRRRSKKTSKLRVTGLCAGNSPHKWPVTRKMFRFDDVIMSICNVDTTGNKSKQNDQVLGWHLLGQWLCYWKCWNCATCTPNDKLFQILLKLTKRIYYGKISIPLCPYWLIAGPLGDSTTVSN